MKKTLSIEAMHAFYTGELGHAISRIENLETRLSTESELNSQGDWTPYQVMDGVAIYKISGPLLSSGNEWTRWLGYSSYEDIRNDLLQAANDPAVKEIMIMAASPGGSVFGVTDASDAIRKISTTIKPIYVFSSKNVASGMYWLASAAKMLIGTPESEWGSIGVIVTHTSFEKQLENDGVKVTVIKSDELKAVGGPYKDLTDKEIAHIQQQVDQYNDLFHNHVQAMRPQVRLSSMRGQTFIGAEAQRMGLIDAVMAYDEAIEYIKALRPKTTQAGGYSMKMTAEQLRVALDAGQTLETLGLSQEEVDEILASAAVPEPEGEGTTPEPETNDGTPGDDDVVMALAAATQLVEVKEAEILELVAKVEAATKTAEKMRDVVVGVINNRRVALGMSALDMSKFSLESVMQDYDAVTEQFEKSFKPGGIFAQVKKVEEPTEPVRSRTEAGLMQAAAIQ